MKWKDFITMEIHPETLENYTELEIIALGMHEMTFWAHSAEELEKTTEEIFGEQ